MGDSNFVNAHGLTEAGQESTARDMGKLAFAAYRNQDIREAVLVEKLKFPKKGWVDEFMNTNQLLPLPFVTGMKTGFTNAAGRCLISSGNYEGRQVLVVVLGSDRKHVFEDSEALLRWSLRVPDDFPPPEPEEVEGEGVIGRKPVIEPGGIHEYNSYCVLETFTGHMEGYYTMVRDADESRIRVA